jgi:stress response protein YsnF
MRITVNPVETPVKETVRVKREQIVVERQPADESADAPSIDQQAFQPTTIELVEMAEVPTAGIQPVITNLITISKQENVRSETVRETLRGTKADVVREPQQVAAPSAAPAAVAHDSAPTKASEALMLPASPQSMTFPVTVAEVKQSLVIDKQQVPAEKVRVSIQPTERPAQQTVQLREERIVVERTPMSETINRLPSDVFAPHSVDVTTMKEIPVVSKRPKVKEWLTIRKHVGEEERIVEAKLKETNLALVTPDESR